MSEGLRGGRTMEAASFRKHHEINMQSKSTSLPKNVNHRNGGIILQ